MAGNVLLINGDPTQGGTDGAVVSGPGGGNPVLPDQLTTGGDSETSPIRLAIRTNPGFQRDGPIAITPQGANASKWAFAPDLNGGPGTFGAWGAAIVLANTITPKNLVFWVKARVTADESYPILTNDLSVTLSIPDDAYQLVAVGRALSQPYAISSGVGRSLGLVFGLRNVAGRSAAMAYLMAGSIGRSLALPYGMSGSVGRSAGLPYGIGGVAGRSLGMPFVDRVIVGRSAGLPYSILQLGTSVRWLRLEIPNAVGPSPGFIAVTEVQLLKASDSSNVATSADNHSTKSVYYIAGYEGPKATDGVTGTHWLSNYDDLTSTWIQFRLPTAQTISKIRIYGGYGPQNLASANVYVSALATPGAKTYGVTHADWTSKGAVTGFTTASAWQELDL